MKTLNSEQKMKPTYDTCLTISEMSLITRLFRFHQSAYANLPSEKICPGLTKRIISKIGYDIFQHECYTIYASVLELNVRGVLFMTKRLPIQLGVLKVKKVKKNDSS